MLVWHRRCWNRRLERREIRQVDPLHCKMELGWWTFGSCHPNHPMKKPTKQQVVRALTDIAVGALAIAVIAALGFGMAHYPLLFIAFAALVFSWIFGACIRDMIRWHREHRH